MTIRLRILALLSFLSLLCFGATWYFNRLHADEEVFARQQRVDALSSRLQRLISATRRPATRYLQDFSTRVSLVEFLANRDPARTELLFKGITDADRFDAVWVLDAEGAVIHGQARSTDLAIGTPPVPADEIRAILQKNRPFEFHEFIGDRLYYIEGQPVGSPGLVSPGWLVVAQQWSEATLRDLADAAQGNITLTPPTHVSDVRNELEMEVWLPLLDHRGSAIGGLDYHMIDSLMENPAMEEIELMIVAFNGVGAVLLVAILMHFWILRPFSLVRASLVERDPAPLAPLLKQRNEFGQVARLVQSSMWDRKQLLLGQEEKMRLGRELHDGVIQSVYGTGMALSRVQALMNRDLPAAQQLLDETKAELNRIILDLRRHIAQADPKPLETTFGAAVEKLIQQFCGSGPVRANLDIDENLVAGYALPHRSQALQFVREAVSNAVRHGHPSAITVSWRRTDGGSVLMVADDGIGFDPAIDPGGRGLGNLSERAVLLGGRLEITSRPNEGTRICLKLPNPNISA